VMLFPKYVLRFPQEEKSYKNLVNACCPKIEDFILVSLTYSGSKRESEVNGLIEDLFKDVGMYYVKWRRKAPEADFYNYEISMDRKHLDLVWRWGCRRISEGFQTS